MNLFIILIVFLISISGMTAFQPVDMNHASKEQLMALPGIGEKLARRIIEHREKKGGFLVTEDLLLVDGFKPKLLEKIKDQIFLKKRLRISPVPQLLQLPKKEKIEPDFQKNRVSQEEIRNLMTSFDQEPSIRLVQDQAIRYANAHPAQVNSWLKRVRQAAWIPQIQTKGGRNLDKGQSIREKVGDTEVFYHKESADWSFDLQAEWKLGDLIFSQAELNVAHESARQTTLREDIIENVTHHYFERRRLQVLERLAVEEDVQQKILRQIQIQELTAKLDGFTGGWFSEQLQFLSVDQK